MGGHGGLNILPQKKWNVYNFDNREKVRKDEESAAKSAQHERDLSRRHASLLRLQKLRRTNHPSPPPPPPAIPAAVPGEVSEDGKHMNLFEGIRIFDPIKGDETKRKRREEEESERRKKMMKTMRMKKEEVREVGPEDEKYRLGYGVAGKGVKAPWYAVKRSGGDGFGVDGEEEIERREVKSRRSVVGKKSVEELREERLRRETAEKERVRALLMSRTGGGSHSSSSRGRDGERRQWR